MKLYIKNMVCNRCKLVVGNLLQDLNLIPISISLGEVDLGVTISNELVSSLQPVLEERLETYGFELLSGKKARLIEQIKKLCIEFVMVRSDLEQVKLSKFLSRELNYDYNYLSQLFSGQEGVTIEHYFIKQRIEKAKELLVYNEISLSEIAFQLSYSSVAHLSGQFKKITGLTPSHFRSLKEPNRRKALDTL